MNAVKENAYAKVNLFLDVISKRHDGFHDIKTVMHSVSLADYITVFMEQSKETSVSVRVQGVGFLPTDKKNLAVRAAYLFLERASITAKIHIKIEKNIPIAAGLAGGSADAAAVLRALNRLAGKIFTERMILSMAEELGSDVPYCVQGKTAICEGRGEIITRLSCAPKFYFVIAVGDEHVSTPFAYTALDALYSDFDGSISTGGDEYFADLTEKLSSENILPSSLFNVFEAVILPKCESARKIKSRLLELGAANVLMSGSGPSVFGIFCTEEHAQKCAAILKSEHYNAHFAVSV